MSHRATLNTQEYQLKLFFYFDVVSQQCDESGNPNMQVSAWLTVRSQSAFCSVNVWLPLNDDLENTARAIPPSSFLEPDVVSPYLPAPPPPSFGQPQQTHAIIPVLMRCQLLYNT